MAYCDPHFPATPATRRHHLSLTSVPLSAEEFGRYDLILLSTAHREFNDPSLYGTAKLVVDTRNVVKEEWGPRVLKA